MSWVVLCACGGAPEIETPGLPTPPVSGAAPLAEVPQVPATSNPSSCPATWAEARVLCDADAATGAACSADLQCWYPGMGDGLPDGTFAPGLLECSTDPSHPSPNRWLCAQ